MKDNNLSRIKLYPKKGMKFIMNIDSIKNGFVIDHIQAGKAMEIYEKLNLNNLNCQVAIITNAKSKKTGKKDIIKIDKNIDIDIDTLGFIDPNITINIVKDDKIVEKFHPEEPTELVNIVECQNPRCITSVEKDLDQIFILTDKEKQIYRCKYCEMSLKK